MKSKKWLIVPLTIAVMSTMIACNMVDRTITTGILSDEEKEDLKHGEQQYYLQQALEMLKEDDVTVITLFYLKELRLDEIAEITGWEANAAKVKLHRARKRLAEKMRLILKEEVNSLL